MGQKRAEFSSNFSKVDRSDPRSMMTCMDQVRADHNIQAGKHLLNAMLDVQAGHRILDVGCGTGEDVGELAQLVGRKGRAVGVDISESMISEARDRGMKLEFPVEFKIGDACQLDFESQSFDSCRSERCLQHVENPSAAISEMVRVTQTNGKVAAMESDWGSAVIDSPNRDVTRRFIEFACDRLAGGWIGRQLYGLFAATGLVDLVIVPHTTVVTNNRQWKQTPLLGPSLDASVKAGVLKAEEALQWRSQLLEADQAGRFFFSITSFIVSGRKA